MVSLLWLTPDVINTALTSVISVGFSFFQYGFVFKSITWGKAFMKATCVVAEWWSLETRTWSFSWLLIKHLHIVLWELFFYPTLIWEDLYSEYFFMLQYDPANPNLYASRLFLLLMTFPFVEHMTFFRGHHVVGIHNMSVLWLNKNTIFYHYILTMLAEFQVSACKNCAK